ncbi:hypothetical protein COCON_G00140220 [Conger conger]|uniref:Uncharacterized protein n=1 Tax=Conger conger TaxID=82655 RepID=A0A9Q1DAK2_CONCO|nr:hypothetical protein COCON_G00140220 [Conger conger]
MECQVAGLEEETACPAVAGKSRNETSAMFLLLRSVRPLNSAVCRDSRGGPGVRGKAGQPRQPLCDTEQHKTPGHYPAVHQRQKPVTDICFKTDISSLMDFSTPDSSLDKAPASYITTCFLGRESGCQGREESITAPAQALPLGPFPPPIFHCWSKPAGLSDRTTRHDRVNAVASPLCVCRSAQRGPLAPSIRRETRVSRCTSLLCLLPVMTGPPEERLAVRIDPPRRSIASETRARVPLCVRAGTLRPFGTVLLTPAETLSAVGPGPPAFILSFNFL